MAKKLGKYRVMKNIRVVGILLMTMFLIFSCKTNKTMASTEQNIHRKWMLVEYKDFTKQELTKLEAYMDLSKRPEAPNQYGAKMGCNGMFFTAEFDKGKAKFSGVGSTMMYCDGRMKLEELFGKDLPNIDQYKIEGHFLTLTDGKSTMKFVAADWD